MLIDKSSDEQIVREVVNGDVERFRIIINRYQNHIFSIGMRFFRNKDDSDDYVQDIFLKAFNELGSYKERAPFRVWLIRIAYNYGINIVKAKKSQSLINEDELSDESTPEKSHVKDETIAILRKAIDALPDKYRICVDLFFFTGCKYTEIMEITGYPVNTIKSNVLRAKKILRNKLRGTIAEDYHEM